MKKIIFLVTLKETTLIKQTNECCLPKRYYQQRQIKTEKEWSKNRVIHVFFSSSFSTIIKNATLLILKQTFADDLAVGYVFTGTDYKPLSLLLLLLLRLFRFLSRTLIWARASWLFSNLTSKKLQTGGPSPCLWTLLVGKGRVWCGKNSKSCCHRPFQRALAARAKDNSAAEWKGHMTWAE